jgi:hypothetical protein
MANLKNTIINDTGFLQMPSGTTAQRPASPAQGMIRWNTDHQIQEYYNGSIWIPGDYAKIIGSSAEQILNAYPAALDGVYKINLPTVGITPVYCIMNSSFDGGGWMMAMKATRGTTFNYNANYWTTDNTLNPSEINQLDGDAKFETFNKFQATDIMARFPDITTSGGSITGTGTWTWLENNFPAYINTGTSTLLNLFNTANRTFIKDAKTFSGWQAGVFSSQKDIRFYGFNWQENGVDTKSRWGFGWNENGGGLFPAGIEGSGDVGGGIGMRYRGGVNYSAGDHIGCCQDSTGINRSARVEIYVR